MEKKDWNILLVDDEKEFVSTLAERLELRGIKARVCYDGQSALTEIHENPPQVAVLDILMPGVKGTFVLEQIKEEFPSIQVILLTGQSYPAVSFDTEQAFACLTKPLDLESFVQTLASAMEVVEGVKHD